MTDVPDGSGPIRRTRVNDGGAPASGALAIVLALLAVVAGFFVLRSITDGGDDAGGLDFGTEGGSSGAGDEAAGDESATESTTVASSTTSTVPPIVTAGATVVVANANGLSGSAGAMSDALSLGPGYDVAPPTNSADGISPLEETIIYYDTTVPAAQVVAESLGRSLGGVNTIEPLPDPIPTSDGSMNGAQVLLMLGLDKANQTLEELNPTAATVVESPAPTETSAPADG